MGKTCEPKAFSFQCMTKFTTNKKKKRKRKKKIPALFIGIVKNLQNMRKKNLMSTLLITENYV